MQIDGDECPMVWVRRRLVFQQEGYDFMAAAFEVYNEIGYGMAEEIYQQSLEIELSLWKMPFATKEELDVYYKGQKLATCYKPDLLVFGVIVVELKAVHGTAAGARSPAVQLHARVSNGGGLPRQLRPPR